MLAAKRSPVGRLEIHGMKGNRLNIYLQRMNITCIVSFFILTGISKYRMILPAEHTMYLLIPSIEWIIALALIFPRTRGKALIAAMMILLLWTSCNGYRVVTGTQLPFSYGGIHASFNPAEHFYLSAAMLLLSCMTMTLFLINSYHDSRSSRIPV